MVVSNLLFDIMLFGGLLLASILDGLFPVLHGTALLLVLGAATYGAAQEWCDALARRRWWSQESLSTSLALSTGGFIYFWWRNDSDLALLCLSIGLMMTSLMVAISVISGLGTAFKEAGLRPVGGLLLTIVGALALGMLAGLLSLTTSIAVKTFIFSIGIVLWKLREKMRPPAENTMSHGILTGATGAAARPVAESGARESLPGFRATTGAVAPAMAGGAADLASGMAPHALAAHAGGRWLPIPQRGTLLDRFLPVLLLAAVLFLTMKETGHSVSWPASPASASSNEPAK